FVALELSSKVFSALACGDPQNNSRTPDLIPRRRVTVSDPLQLGHVRRGDRQHLGLAATHTRTSHAETEPWFSISGCSNSVQVFVPETLVSPARKPALNSRGMFSEPGTHLLIGPGPFKGMGVPMVVFRP